MSCNLSRKRCEGRWVLAASGMACLEAVARAGGIPTRVRALHVKGEFWYPRFRLSCPFIPQRILLVWPQFFLQGMWVDFDEIYSPIEQLAAKSGRFGNGGESLFEAVRHTAVDFLGKTCSVACARPEHDLSMFVQDDAGFFDTRDEVFERFGSFQHTLRGRAFEIIFGGRNSRWRGGACPSAFLHGSLNGGGSHPQ